MHKPELGSPKKINLRCICKDEVASLVDPNVLTEESFRDVVLI
jgi:hypothetical protein